MPDPVLVTNPARPREHGSGFVIRLLDGDGGAHVLTCAHVVRSLGADGLRVADQPAQVVVDLGAQGIDLAVLSVAGMTEPAPLLLGRGTVGAQVELLGVEPAGGGPLSVPHRGRLAASSLTALAGRNRPAWHLELTDGSIEGGHSGGPVIDVTSGRVVGVISMGPDQRGGRDGVAVAIENLKVWAEAPPIAPAARRPHVDDPDSSTAGTSDDELLPHMIRPRRQVWILAGVGAAVAVGAVALVISQWPAARSSTSPAVDASLPPCAIPDLRDGFEAAPVADWCPDALVGDVTCAREFDDRSKITGHCRGTDAVGEWSARDGTGAERWSARFAEAGRFPTAVFVQTKVLTSGAQDRTELTRGVRAGTPPLDASHRELSCKRDGTFASVVRDRADLARPDVEVELTVPGGVLTCAITVTDPAGPLALASTDRATSCSIDEQTVTGQFAIDTYKRLLSAEVQIRACNLPVLPALASCGDSKKSEGEECDPGRETAACDGDCTLRKCGDGYLNTLAGEQCDDRGETARCNADCTLARCGDGVVNRTAREACDPARVRATPGDSATCDDDCSKPECGDAHVNVKAGEACEPPRVGGALTNTVDCDTDCTRPRCNDRILNLAAGEGCEPPAPRVCSKTCQPLSP